MNNDKDKFIEIVKEKLTDYMLPVDDDSWDKIEERLNHPLRKNSQLWWIAPVAVAASIALLFLLFPIKQNTPRHETAIQLSGHDKPTTQDTQDIHGNETVQPTSHQNISLSPVYNKPQYSERLAENNHTNEVIPDKNTTEENPISTQANVESSESKNKETSASDNYSASKVYNFDFDKEKRTPVIKRKKRQSLRFSFGSGANLLAENNTNHIPQDVFINGQGVYLNSSMGFYILSTSKDIQLTTETILSSSNYPNVVCHVPLSFGITMKKELNRTFAIESGVVYTFLSTNFSKNSFPISNANLQLHYIGIPLNIHTHIYGNRSTPWEVYLSTGGTVEKGILSHLVQNTYYSGPSATTSVSKDKINGLQWSVGISPGVDYRLYKNYSIYLEPKLSYSFDNDQPVSARTKHPLSFGLNAGIRYSW